MSGNKHEYEIRLTKIKFLGFGLFVSFFLCAIAAYYSRQYGAALGILGFSIFGLYLFLAPGRYIFSDDCLIYISMFGRHRIFWKEVELARFGTGRTLALYGNQKRFMILPPSYWTGSGKEKSWMLLMKNLSSSQIVPQYDRKIDYMINKNCKF